MNALITFVLLLFFGLTVTPVIFATIIFRSKDCRGTRIFLIASLTVTLLSTINFALSMLETYLPNFKTALPIYWTTEAGMWAGVIVACYALIEVCEKFAQLAKQTQHLEEEVAELSKQRQERI